MAEDFFTLRIILSLPLARSLNDPFLYFANVARPILLPGLLTPFNLLKGSRRNLPANNCAVFVPMEEPGVFFGGRRALNFSCYPLH